MRILQVATLFTPDGAYGGPTRVALNQSRELARRGHQVTVAGAASGFAPVPTTVDGVRLWFHPAVTVVPGIGFAGLAARGLTRRILRCAHEFDVIHVHVSRDFVTLPAARVAQISKRPTVLQPHGMVDVTEKMLARPVDLLLTRPALRRADRVLYLTANERRRIEQFAGAGLGLASLRNGVPRYDPPVQSTRPRPEVLFLARLHPRKRPTLFARIAGELLARGLVARFTIAGPDGGCGGAVDAEIARIGSPHLVREPAVAPDDVAARLARAAVYVLPSVDEPYPMTVLEAMGVGRPVVVTRSCGLADTVRHSDCGIVVDEAPAALAAAIATLIDAPDRAAAAGLRGRAVARSEFSMEAIVDDLERTYRDVVACGGA